MSVSEDHEAADVGTSEMINAVLLDEVNRSGKWFHARKTCPIWAKPVEQDQSVRTLEGEVRVTAGDLLCRGLGGEIWPQKSAQVERKYTPTEEVDAAGWRKYVPRQDAEGVMASQVDHPFLVMGARGTLFGKAGDFVVKSFRDRGVVYPDDVWIVDQVLFRQTYEEIPACG